jgi:DNA (cytosine-5)-methyltransferase 1
MRPIGIDLFAGAGGLSLGFEQAGFDIAAAVELDPIHCAAHKFNFPDCATICRSVTDIDGAEIRRLAGIGGREIAAVVGGAPCQGFSLIGKRALDDPRNALVHHFVRLVLELQPRYFVFENVKGLTIGAHRQFLEEVMAAFEDNGYRVLKPYRVLNAADYGVPQDRRRLFLIGARSDAALPIYPTPRPGVTVWEAIGDLPEAEQFPELATRDWVRAEYGAPSAYARRLRVPEDDGQNYSHPRRFDRNLLTSSLRAEHTPLSRSRFAATAPGETEPVSRFHKLDPAGVCNTLRAGTASDRGAFTSPRPIHPLVPRCITVREAARLHSYPDWFRFHVTKWHGFRQIGNSVPPLLAQAVAGELMKAMGETPERPKQPLELGDKRLLSASMAEAAETFGVPATVIAKRNRKAAPRERETVHV